MVHFWFSSGSDTVLCCSFFFEAEDGIRDRVRSGGLGGVYKRQDLDLLVLDRTTGKPIKGAKAWAYVRNQDHSGNRRFIGVEEFTTSEEGMVLSLIHISEPTRPY